jgi:drug/metabolite transporter (DMT)-like permease
MNINLSTLTLFILTLSTNIIGPVNLKIMSQLNIKRDITLFIALAIFHIIIVSTRMVTWFKILKRVRLSIAYPVISVTFPAVLIISNRFFGERITLTKLIGIFLIITGLIINSYGYVRD